MERVKLLINIGGYIEVEWREKSDKHLGSWIGSLKSLRRAELLNCKMGSERAVLGVVDYIIFTFMLLVSAGIGLYFRFSGGKQKTMDEFLLGGRNMPMIPVAASIMASYLSAVAVIGSAAEVYLFGTLMSVSMLMYPIGIGVVAYVFIPVFFKLDACTAYEYLEKRFGKLLRTFTSVMFVFQTILYLSVLLYAPALAVSVATTLSTWTSVLSIGIVCTFYCTLGGMKAVVWTDLFQMLLMFIGIFAILIKGILDVGFSEVFRRSYEGGRIDLPGFSLSLTERYTVWNLLLNGFVFQLMVFGANQIQVQRLLTLKNVYRCRKALYFGVFISVLFSILIALVGLVIYAHFYKCDPLSAPNKPISKADQLFPYYMVTVLGSFPGLSGIAISGIFGAALSSLSSGMNSLSAVTMQDLVKPYLETRRFSEKKMALIAKALTLFYGVLSILMTFFAESFDNLVQAALIVYGICGAPTLAVFLLGMLTTRTNEKGAIIGLLSSGCFTAWVSFGAAANRRRPKILPLSTESCPAIPSLANVTSSPFPNTTTMSMFPETSTLYTTSAVPKMSVETPYVFPLYRLSHIWYMPFGVIIGLIIGYISSIIISRITGEYPDVQEEFLSPVFVQLFGKKEGSKEKEMEITVKEKAEGLNNEAPNHNSTI